MRRTLFIAAFCSFLLFMLAGYRFALWIGERDQKHDTVQASHTIQSHKTIQPQTKIIYQYYYTRDKATKEQWEMAPLFLQGLNMEQLSSIYEGWQILLFSPEKVILRCRIEGLSNETYLLGENNGFLTIFYEDEEKKLHLKEQTELPLSVLPEGQKRQIEEGFRVTGEENLAKILADLMS